MNENRGLLSSLFDFTFESFITPGVIKLLYIIGVFLAAVGAVGFIVAGFGMNGGLGFLALIISPVIFLLYTLLVRVGLEMVMILFRMADDLRAARVDHSDGPVEVEAEIVE
jgi:hypothetical protein